MNIDAEDSAIRLGVVDDHAVLRVGLSAWLAEACQDVVVVAAVASWPEMLAHPAFPTDVVLLDLDLRDGVPTSVKIASAASAGVKVVIVSTYADPGRVRECIAAGALGYVPKSEDPEEILTAIRSAIAGQAHLTASVAASLLTHSDAHLSPQERQVLSLYASGLPMKIVAKKVGVQYETAKGYLDNVRLKYAATGREARTKIELRERAEEDGLIERH